MVQRTYPVVIEVGETGRFGGFFPDLPGCGAGGDTVEACHADAQAALTLHLAGMIEDGDPLPEPTPLGDVTVDPEVRVAAILLVSAPVTGRTTRLNITMDTTLVAAIDSVTSNRSAWLAEAALRALRDRHDGADRG
ncbi:type II toxin-antitoxin system HicB family antitoxin [Roseospira visakhapatnamensis]|uniref:Putative RNase H-like HicB family nuclease n=1 Tax=Roseospira visakhapatnamensis TaxID=390880 RepID=A0A7W6RGN7_9PROT|nr:type II toxin-antitoxin system HicB family antitoxin [Roseospira visakhapatnamensis]MBB4268208.1 putative RNase H-like HicB family nuclease [Roseospira visakhapatnamensis]